MSAITLESLNERLTNMEERVRRLEDELRFQRYPKIGLTIEEAKARIREPVRRSPESIKQALEIIGMFEGPEDLSENLHSYLYGDKR